MIGVLYVPPARSVNLDDELFEHLQNYIIDIKNEYNIESVCLMGGWMGGSRIRYSIKHFVLTQSSRVESSRVDVESSRVEFSNS